MHILQVPSWFPNTKDPFHGDFLYDLMCGLAKELKPEDQLGVLLAETYHYYWDELWSSSERLPLPSEINLVKNRGKFLPIKTRIGFWTYKIQVKNLYNQYVKRFGQPDIIHTHIHPAARAIAAIGLDIPLVYTEQSSALLSDSEEHVAIVKNIGDAAKLANRTIAISSHMKKKLDSYSPKVDLLFNPVDTEEFLPLDKEVSAKLRLISVGFLQRHKGFYELIDAVNLLDKDGIEFELTIVGSGPEMLGLERSIRQKGLDGKVFLIGKKPKSEIAKILGKFDLFVMASYFEPFGIVVTEALSCGLPCVVTRSGGPSDVISMPFLGEVSEPRDVQSLYTALKSTIDRIDDFDPAQIRQYVEENYSQKNLINRLMKLYSDLDENP